MTKPTPTEEQRRKTRETWTNPEIVGQDVGGACRAVRSLCDDLDAAIDRAEKAEDWLRRIQPLVDAAADGMKKVAATDAWAEMEKARANLATLQREHDELRRSTEAMRVGIAEALGLTEWRGLAALIDDVTDLGDALASARAEVARLREYRAAQERGEDYWTGIRDENTSLRAEVARLRALAASRAEVVGLRAALRDLVEQMHARPQPYVDGITFTTGTDVFAYYDAALAALSSTPAPASAEPATPTTEGGAK